MINVRGMRRRDPARPWRAFVVASAIQARLRDVKSSAYAAEFGRNLIAQARSSRPALSDGELIGAGSSSCQPSLANTGERMTEMGSVRWKANHEALAALDAIAACGRLRVDFNGRAYKKCDGGISARQYGPVDPMPSWFIQAWPSSLVVQGNPLIVRRLHLAMKRSLLAKLERGVGRRFSRV